VRVFDVDTAPLTAPNTLDPAGDQLRGAFAATLASISLAAGGGVAGQQAVVQAYHTTVAPFCSKAAQGFFAQVLATIPFPFP
jgi:hypothetical protein